MEEKLIILTILKTFKGQLVTDYPCKGTKISEGEYSEGSKLVNPSSVDEKQRGKIWKIMYLQLEKNLMKN